MAEENQTNLQELEWSAREYPYFRKDFLWYAIVILLTLGLAGMGLWLDNFTFSVFIILAGILIIFWGQREPERIDFRITNKAVYIDDDIAITHKELEGFDVHHHEHKQNEIIIKKNTQLNPFVKMPAPGHTVDQAEKILSRHVSRDKYEESLLDNLADWIRF